MPCGVDAVPWGAMSAPVANAAERPPATATVAVDRATVLYGNCVALNDVSVAFAPGSLTALVGPNGAGKSTLLNVLAGTVAVAHGAVHTVARPAYVLQRTDVPARLPLTVRDAVAMGRWADRGPLRRLTADDRALVSACLDRLGITELAERPVGELSGGQHQRMLVAQGLAQRSPLLLLDEPVTGLDAVARDVILDVITAERAAGTVVVMCTHELSEANLADQVVLMVDGAVRAAGPPAEVLRADVLAAAYGQVVALADGQRVVVLPASHHEHGHDHSPGHAPGPHGHEHRND